MLRSNNALIDKDWSPTLIVLGDSLRYQASSPRNIFILSLMADKETIFYSYAFSNLI